MNDKNNQNTILIIDDNETNIKVLVKVLQNHGFETITARNGTMGIRQARFALPDLILLDIMMPGIDGFETCRRLKKDETTSNLPIIFLTANTDTVDKIKGLEMGAVDYIIKPFETAEIVARVRKHLTIYNLQKQLEEKNTQLQAHVHHLENLATLEKAINETQDIVQMMNSAMQVTLSVFKCDRAWLIYPCDPDAPTWQIPVEITTPEYHGANILGTDIPMDSTVSEVMRISLSATGPIASGDMYEHKVAPMIVKELAVQSQISTTIHPKIGSPWLFGIHQCSHARVWTENELNLFRDFGQYIGQSFGIFISLKRLQDSEKQFRDYFESALIGFAITSLEKNWVYANKCVRDILGYSWEELQKLSWAELTYPDDLTADVVQFEQLLAGKIDSYTIDKRFIHKNGSIVYIFVSVMAHYKENGTVDYIVATLQDITERKQTEEQLRKLSRAVEQSGSTIVITNLDGTIEFVNPFFSKATGYSYDEAIGQNPRVLKSGKMDPEVYRNLWDTIKRGEVWQGEMINKKKNGELYWEYATISPVKNEMGQTTHYLAIKDDITERKRAENELQKANINLSKTNQDLQLLNNQMQDELSLAREIQYSLFPEPQPDWSQLEVVCFTMPAQSVGGDFYTYHKFTSHLVTTQSIGTEEVNSRDTVQRYAIAVGDVSGKGVSAALLMAVSLSQLNAMFVHDYPPTERLAHLDEGIMHYTKPRQQNCALCYIEIDKTESKRHKVETSIMTVVNAGCIPPYIKRANGEVEFHEIGGFALGQGIGAMMGYQQHTFELAPGDIVILTSDGVVEAINRTGKLLGFERLMEIIIDAPTTSAKNMLKHLNQEVFAFTGDAKQHDDMTMVVIQI